MIANTDTRHYQQLSDNTFRFSPTFLRKNDLDRFHGLDERISVENYAQVILRPVFNFAPGAKCDLRG
jgi:carboxypeptidase PM20D1